MAELSHGRRDVRVLFAQRLLGKIRAKQCKLILMSVV